MSAQQCKNIIVGITGGIAAYKSAILVRRLKEYGYDVRVVMTQGALAFITPLTLQALSGNPVHTTLLDTEAEKGMGHIELAKWADLILIAPASCDTLAHLAHGFADDLLSTLCLATIAPIWLAPAMNQQMWQAKTTQRNLKLLADDGFYIVQPASGEQACGDVGVGRMPEPEQIALQVHQYFLQQNMPLILAGKKVTITAGPTREAIDPVRYISNHSTGKMGFTIAQVCEQAGAEVTLIAGPVYLDTPKNIQRINVQSAQQMLDASLQSVENGCDIFIATAAVADYRVAEVAEHKIKKTSDKQDMILELVKNPDIVATIAQLTNAPFMVGFAAETQNVEQYASKKLVDKKLDMIACNDVSRTDIGFGADDNAMVIFFAEQYQKTALKLEKASKHKIAQQLITAIAENIPK
ncbi:bifunctional phosphopantothenoylcysteine decarboxylase/phosphopantothenate--cysteine ligase CoaBC [Moraxella sp. ZY210820]|uniref:bifunctional phosphopantothenoylcysteine decarboxylase/phosphopantothenate--cysteine ligase CoaBC n=1 Tax=unclassified Moraxella TaxID=2685852 RepID=UPI00272F8873|nr:bifunctional phosphopantothenoylcysteine decarboxylase/phosphopantothenate--cysteine ligase CoaBC [Moraxella sp. ZY210820]WLF83892.1 bifunctional phosphopantothenoylcysteine decarboxylase/phosphopantothenate--cysteine ligase CoaBC [Moraxella sp. ZY210820]